MIVVIATSMDKQGGTRIMGERGSAIGDRTPNTNENQKDTKVVF